MIGQLNYETENSVERGYEEDDEDEDVAVDTVQRVPVLSAKQSKRLNKQAITMD